MGAASRMRFGGVKSDVGYKEIHHATQASRPTCPGCGGVWLGVSWSFDVISVRCLLATFWCPAVACGVILGAQLVPVAPDEDIFEYQESLRASVANKAAMLALLERRRAAGKADPNILVPADPPGTVAEAAAPVLGEAVDIRRVGGSSDGSSGSMPEGRS